MTPRKPETPRAAVQHARPAWVVWGLSASLLIFLYALSAAVKTDQAPLKPPKLKEEQLEALAVGMFSDKSPQHGWLGTGEAFRCARGRQASLGARARWIRTPAAADGSPPMARTPTPLPAAAHAHAAAAGALRLARVKTPPAAAGTC